MRKLAMSVAVTWLVVVGIIAYGGFTTEQVQEALTTAPDARESWLFLGGITAVVWSIVHFLIPSLWELFS